MSSPFATNPCRRLRRRLRPATLIVTSVLLAASLVAGFAGAAQPALATGGSPQLMAGAGQFFPISQVKVLDTRDGTGGVPTAPLAANATATFQVTGVGQVPASGVSDVYIVINAINPTASGALEDYDADLSNPGIWTLPFTGGGVNSTVSDMVQVGAAGFVAVTNASSGTVDVAVTVVGYVQDGTVQTAGETYAGVPETAILDTRSGLGAPQAKIPAGGSVTIQVAGQGGVPSDAAGAALFLGTDNASATGWVSAYPAGGTDPGLALLSYSPGRKIRNLYYGSLSSSGQLTLVNHGSASVDMMAAVQGYLVSPAASEVGGSYQDVPEQRIADTRDGTGGIPATPVPANGSVTFTATGANGVPTSGVSAVVQTVAALNATASGYLSVYPAGGTDPQQPGVNFNSGDAQDNDLTVPQVSAVSPTGQVRITNHSSGTVDVVVALRGYYQAASVPGVPGQPDAGLQNGTATINWSAPSTDGGAAITSYTVTVYNPDGTVNQSASYGPGTMTATAAGLTSSGTYSASVAAVNAVGAGTPSTSTIGVVPSGWTAPGFTSISADTTLDVDPTTGDTTVVDASGSITNYNADGSTIGSPQLATPTSSEIADGVQPDSGRGFGGYACVINTQQGTTIKSHKPWHDAGQNSLGTIDWYHQSYSIANARWSAGEGWTMEWQPCTTGGGNPRDPYHMWFTGSAVWLQTTKFYRDGAGKWGTTDSYNNHSGAQSVTLGFALPAGKAGSINGQLTFNFDKGDDKGDIGSDGHFYNFPSTQQKYFMNRTNVYWISAHNWPWDGTNGYKGNVLDVLYEWPMSLTTHPHVSSHANEYVFCPVVC